MGPILQACVLWSAGTRPVANIGEMAIILPTLAVLVSCTQTTNQGTRQIRDVNTKHELGKANNLHYTATLEATQH